MLAKKLSVSTLAYPPSIILLTLFMLFRDGDSAKYSRTRL